MAKWQELHFWKLEQFRTKNDTHTLPSLGGCQGRQCHKEVWFRLKDQLLFDIEMGNLYLCGIIIFHNINLFTLSAFVFLPQIPIWINWTSIWHLLTRPNFLPGMALNCSFLVSCQFLLWWWAGLEFLHAPNHAARLVLKWFLPSSLLPAAVTVNA